ncbi:hypothetical protein BKA70DRAFT_691382 [Coprinopsis sp. MPI-PUGE-AT-0042]|nr:hypothetical protein BKA70DRAFT_691382 [Coprinopsis sp. MPI-PUGE-AT-0042]
MASDQALVRVFLALQLTGCFIFVVMFASALVFASTVKRHPIWFSFCLSFIIFSFSYSLLVFTGGQQDASELAMQGVCRAQAALIYAAPFLAPSASMALIALLLVNIVCSLAEEERKAPPMIMTIALVGPWFLWAAVLSGATIFILRDTSVVALSPSNTFCIVTRSILPRLSATAAAFFAFVILILEIAIAYLLYQHRAVEVVFRQQIAMAIRTFIISAVTVSAVVTGILFAGTKDSNIVFDVMIAMVPFVASITFATQRDLWERYMFWKKPPHSFDTEDQWSSDTPVLKSTHSSVEQPSWGYSSAMGRFTLNTTTQQSGA